jgi:hypothetical protein
VLQNPSPGNLQGRHRVRSPKDRTTDSPEGGTTMAITAGSHSRWRNPGDERNHALRWLEEQLRWEATLSELRSGTGVSAPAERQRAAA